MTTTNMTTDQEREVIDFHRQNLELMPTKSLDIRATQSNVRETEDDATTPGDQTPHEYTGSYKEGNQDDDIYKNKPKGFMWIAMNATIFLSAFIYGLDTTIAANIQPQIYLSLGELTKLSWIGTGFVMGAVSTILTWGNLYGLLNIKWLYAFGCLLFSVGSVVCGASNTMNGEICGRVIAGIGGASLYLGALSYVSAFNPLADRAMYEAGIGFFWGLGTIVGPLIGGAFAQISPSGWRWSFYVIAILGFIELAIMVVFFPSYENEKGQTTLQKLRSVDWLGATLMAAWFSFFVSVLSIAGTTYSWSSGASIALWVVWAVVTLAFVAQQGLCILTTKERRIFPVDFLTNKTVMLTFVYTSGVACALWIIIYFTPLYLQFTKGDGAVKSGLRMLSLVLSLIIAIMISGGSFAKVERPAAWVLFGSLLTTAAGAAMFKIDPTTKVTHIYGFLILVGFGVGACMQLGYAIACAAVPVNRIPAAIGIVNIAQIGSGAIALSIAGSLFQNLGQNYLKNDLTAAGFHFSRADIESALAGADSVILSGAGNERLRAVAIAAIVKAITRCFILVMVGGAVGAICALGLSWKKPATPLAPIEARRDGDADEVEDEEKEEDIGV